MYLNKYYTIAEYLWNAFYKPENRAFLAEENGM